MFSNNIFELFIWFVIYSFFGWLWEEIICSVPAKKLLNRGFMSGPYCPIYGTGAMLFLLLLHITTKPFQLFFIGGFAACVLEYLTSYVMEKLFHARWWDYSKRFLNINGRVCMAGFCAFGFFASVFPFIHRHIAAFTHGIPNIFIIIAAILIALSMLSDLAATVESMLKMNKAMASYEDAIEHKDHISFRHRNHKSFEMRIKERHEKHKVLGMQQRRLIRNFPNFDSKYGKALHHFKEMNLENVIVVKDSKKEQKDIKKESKEQSKHKK